MGSNNITYKNSSKICIHLKYWNEGFNNVRLIILFVILFITAPNIVTYFKSNVSLYVVCK